MNNKTTQLDAEIQKLSELVNELKVLERQYDKDLEHASNYLGNDDRIEKGRDEIAMATLTRVTNAKKEIGNQLQLVRELVASY